MYVEELVAPGVVNTMPEATIHAFADHGEVRPDAVTGSYAAAQKVLDDLAALGIDYDDVVATLEREGVEKFDGQLDRAAGPARKEQLDGRSESKCSRDVLDDVEAAAGLSVYGAGLRCARRRGGPRGADQPRACRRLLVGRRTRRCGATAAEAEAKIRLGWVDTFRRSRELLPQLRRAAGRSSPAWTTSCWPAWAARRWRPRSSARTLGKPLTVLDTTDPHQVRAALADRLDRTVVVVSSKSGSTVETDSHRRAYLQAFLDAGMTEPEAGRRFVIVTDPGSPLEATAARWARTSSSPTPTSAAATRR